MCETHAAEMARVEIGFFYSLNEDMQWHAPASGRRRRQNLFSDVSIEFEKTLPVQLPK